VGNVGGDLFKAVFIAREQPGRRTLAVATVFVDRLSGLFGLILLATLTIAILGLPVETTETIALRKLVYIAATGGAVTVVLLMLPGFTTSPLLEWAINLPKIGGLLEHGISAFRMYRRQPLVLLNSAILSVAVHLLMTIAISLVARGLFANPPTFPEHLIIVPLSNLVGALPVTPAGLGTFEVAMESLYRTIPADKVDASAVTVALAFRVITIGVAAVGMCVYWWNRREFTLVDKYRMK
jgi:glycosyltransferase 2 family protein